MKIKKLIRQDIPELQIPDDVFVEKTEYEERQAMLREIDMQKRKDNPEFKGAFHEKKESNLPPDQRAQKKKAVYGKKFGKRR